MLILGFFSVSSETLEMFPHIWICVFGIVAIENKCCIESSPDGNIGMFWYALWECFSLVGSFPIFLCIKLLKNKQNKQNKTTWFSIMRDGDSLAAQKLNLILLSPPFRPRMLIFQFFA